MKFMTLLAFALFVSAASVSAQEDGRTQYPGWLQDSYIDFGPGWINYPFSQRQLEPGYHANEISIPNAGARVTLFGHNFTPHLSAQITYLRPVQWVRYAGINGMPARRSVWMNVAGVTARGTLPLGDRFSAYAEGGLGIVTRHGFDSEDGDIVADANYATVLFGTGIKYRLNRTWDLQAGAVYTPPNDRFRQPQTLMFSGSAVLNLRSDPSGASVASGVHFPRHAVQVGYTTNAFGTGVNHFFSGKVPIFWGGHVDVRQGGAVTYMVNVFHTKKLFALDAGASIARYQSMNDNSTFMTVSVFPRFRFIPVRTKAADVYVFHSVAGPSFISKSSIAGIDTGKRFTFQDMMGLGCSTGPSKSISIEARIGHYSNGNLFTRNAGVKIPLTFSIGYAF